MQLLLIDLGDNTLVKVERGGFGSQGVTINGGVRYLGEGTHLIHEPFNDVRAAIDALEADEPPHLLSCPFCNGEGFVTNSTSDRHYWHIHCSGCDVATVGVTAKELAYSKWNRRGGEIPTVMPKKRGEWKQLASGAGQDTINCEIWRYTCGE